MKLKKFAAVVLAAAMSLVMLTACSGGGTASTGSGWTRKLVTVERDGKEVTNGSTSYYTSDGKWTYSLNISENGRKYESLYNYNLDEDYEVNTDSDPWKAYKVSDTDDGGTVMKPVKTDKYESTGEYKGKTYRTMVYTSTYEDGYKSVSTYYYDGTNLAYIKSENERTIDQTTYNSSSVRKVLIDKNSVDPENKDKLDISKYTLVKTEAELGR